MTLLPEVESALRDAVTREQRALAVGGVRGGLRARLRAAFASWRSRPLVLVLAAFVICGSAAAAVLSLVASQSQPLRGRIPGTAAPTRLPWPRSVAGYHYRITVWPGLRAGYAGWLTGIDYTRGSRFANNGGQAGGGYPTTSDPFFGGTGISYISVGARTQGDSLGFELTSPNVAAIRFAGRTIRTFTSDALPAGDRIAVFFSPPDRLIR